MGCAADRLTHRGFCRGSAARLHSSLLFLLSTLPFCSSPSSGPEWKLQRAGFFFFFRRVQKQTLFFIKLQEKTFSFCSPQPQTARHFLNGAENVQNSGFRFLTLSSCAAGWHAAQGCAELNRCNAFDSLLVRAREEMQNPEEHRGTSKKKKKPERRPLWPVNMSGNVETQVHRRPLLSDSVFCFRGTALFHSCSSSAGGEGRGRGGGFFVYSRILNTTCRSFDSRAQRLMSARHLSARMSRRLRSFTRCRLIKAGASAACHVFDKQTRLSVSVRRAPPGPFLPPPIRCEIGYLTRQVTGKEHEMSRRKSF